MYNQGKVETQDLHGGTTDIAVSVELKNDIELFSKDRTIKQVDLMKKHDISRNTLKKYVELIKEGCI